MADDEDMGDPLTAPLISARGTPDFVHNRRCTDCLCTVLLWAMWASMTFLGIYGLQYGDYTLILFPLDYDGNICGTDHGSIDMTEYPNLYYVNDHGGGVCVKECPQLADLADPYTLVTYNGLWRVDDRANVTDDDIAVADYSASNNTHQCDKEVCYPGGLPVASYNSYGVNAGHGFAFYALDTHEVFRRCIVNEAAAEKVHAVVDPFRGNFTADLVDQITGQSELLTQAWAVWDNLFVDVWIARKFVLGLGFITPLVVGFFYSLLLRVPCVLPLLVWGSIFATLGIFFAGGWFVGVQAREWEDADPPTVSAGQIQAATIGSYVLYVVGGLLVLLFLLMRKRIQLAMGCVKETSRAVTRMPLIILFPVVQALGFLLFVAVWVLYSVHLASLGHFETMEWDVGNIRLTVKWFHYSDNQKLMGLYMLFCLFWSGQFILAMGQIVFAMAMSKWYFTRDKTKIGSHTVVRSIVAALWYHSGTAAFGSLLLAILNAIRAFLAYLQKKAKAMHNSVAEAILCCCQCFFWCMEKCIKFMNKNAYIQTAIFGTSFCPSAKNAFFLILRNAARVTAITIVSGGVEFVGKMFIMSSTVALSYFAMDQYLEEEIHSDFGPLFLIACISWTIACMFMNVYEMGMATILQCFVADEEMFGSDGMFAGGSLQGWVEKNN